MKFVATKTAEQLDLQALHRVRERLVSPRTGIINQNRAFVLERKDRRAPGYRLPATVRNCPLSLRRVPMPCRHVCCVSSKGVGKLTGAGWIGALDGLSGRIKRTGPSRSNVVKRLMAVPGIEPIISSAMVAAIGTGDVFSKGRDFGAWLGLVPKRIFDQEIARSSAKSPGAAIATCAFYLCRRHGLCWSE